MDLEGLKVYLLGELRECRGVLRRFTMEMLPVYRGVVEAGLGELPKMVASRDGDEVRWASERLKGIDIDVVGVWIEELSGCSWDFDAERVVSENDGRLFLLFQIFRLLGMEEAAEESLKYVYRDS